MNEQNPKQPSLGPTQPEPKSLMIPISGLVTQLRMRIGQNGKLKTVDITASLRRKLIGLGLVGLVAGAAFQMNERHPSAQWIRTQIHDLIGCSAQDSASLTQKNTAVVIQALQADSAPDVERPIPVGTEGIAGTSPKTLVKKATLKEATQTKSKKTAKTKKSTVGQQKNSKKKPQTQGLASATR